MHSMTRIAAALLLAFTTTGALAQSAPVSAPVSVPARSYDLDADVNRVLKLFDVPGIAIAIVKDGKVLTARGFGVRKKGEATPLGHQAPARLPDV